MTHSEFKEFMAMLGDPQRSLKAVHVAGTNGKGSTCAMIAKVLSCQGYKTGLFTSPHLFKYNERISIDGVQISDEDFKRLEARVDAAEAEFGSELCFFDKFTAICFLYFAEQKVDYAVIEVGLGGRLDATNVIESPMVSVIANIDLDHTELLGNTVAEIAGEKAGIIKPGRPVVCAAQSAEAEDVFRAEARKLSCPVLFTEPEAESVTQRSLDGLTISYRGRRDIKLALIGNYQEKNAALALDCLDVLRGEGVEISEEAIYEGLRTVEWPGRFEILRRSPLVIVDGAHNPNGVAELAACLESYLPGKKLHFVMGVLADKDYDAMLDIIAPMAEGFTLVTPPSQRALPASELAGLIEERFGVSCRVADSISEGVSAASDNQKESQAVCIFGSLYQVGEVRDCFGKWEQQ